MTRCPINDSLVWVEFFVKFGIKIKKNSDSFCYLFVRDCKNEI